MSWFGSCRWLMLRKPASLCTSFLPCALLLSSADQWHQCLTCQSVKSSFTSVTNNLREWRVRRILQEFHAWHLTNQLNLFLHSWPVLINRFQSKNGVHWIERNSLFSFAVKDLPLYKDENNSEISLIQWKNKLLCTTTIQTGMLWLCLSDQFFNIMIFLSFFE